MNRKNRKNKISKEKTGESKIDSMVISTIDEIERVNKENGETKIN